MEEIFFFTILLKYYLHAKKGTEIDQFLTTCNQDPD